MKSCSVMGLMGGGNGCPATPTSQMDESWEMGHMHTLSTYGSLYSRRMQTWESCESAEGEPAVICVRIWAPSSLWSAGNAGKFCECLVASKGGECTQCTLSESPSRLC